MLDGVDTKTARRKKPQATLSFNGTKIKLLEPEEEYALARAVFDHDDTDARKKLIQSFIPFALTIAKKYYSYGMPYDDVNQEAFVGLGKAAEKFDPDKGFRFATYAAWWVKASIQEAVLKDKSLVRMGTTSAQKTLFFNLSRVERAIDYKYPDANQDEKAMLVAEALGVSLKDTISMQSRIGGDFSLNAKQGDDDGEGREWIDTIEADGTDPTKTIELDDKRAVFVRAVSNLQDLNKLKPRDLTVIQLRRIEEKTLEDTAEAICEPGKKPLSRERIRQIETAALEKITDEVGRITGRPVNHNNLLVKPRKTKRTRAPK